MTYFKGIARALISLLLPIIGMVSFSSLADEYQLGPGDEIKITVYDEPDLTIQAKINKSGSVNFPFLDELKVVGLTSKEVEERVYAGLLGDYLIDPHVTVSIVNYRPFFIHGQVKRPGGYAYQDDLTLDKAIALAGGLTNRASTSDWVLKRLVNGKTITITADITTKVRPDDIIKIEQTFF